MASSYNGTSELSAKEVSFAEEYEQDVHFNRFKNEYNKSFGETSPEDLKSDSEILIIQEEDYEIDRIRQTSYNNKSFKIKKDHDR
jgi:hypothetical protein